MRFVVIGGDAAGMSAASRAKRNMPDMEVVVLERTHDVSYSACGMPYNIADPTREIEDLVVRTADVFRDKQGLDLRLGHEVLNIDPETKTVSGTDNDGTEFNIEYDKLLIATGASPIVPEIDGLDSPGVFVLKGLAHGRAIKKHLDTAGVKQAAIIGMGYIALEMAEALTALGISVSLVKPRPTLLPWLRPELSDMVKRELDENKVALYPGLEIIKVNRADQGFDLECKDITLPCQMILVAVGIAPNSGLAVKAGLDLGSKSEICVDGFMQTSNPDIFAAGDCADAFNIITGGRSFIPLALRANRAGWAVADNLSEPQTSLPGIVGTAVFKVFDMQVARTGLTKGEAQKTGFDPAEIMITANSRAHGYDGSSPMGVMMLGDKKSGRLLGMQIVSKEGAAHRINAPAVALHNKMTVADFYQTDMAYAPPFSPVWDPMLLAARVLLKEMNR